MGAGKDKRKRKSKEDGFRTIKGRKRSRHPAELATSAVVDDFLDCSSCEDAEGCQERVLRLQRFAEHAVQTAIETSDIEFVSWHPKSVLVLMMSMTRDGVDVEAGGIVPPEAMSVFRAGSREQSVIDRTLSELGPMQRWAFVLIDDERGAWQASVIVSRPTNGLFGNVVVGEA